MELKPNINAIATVAGCLLIVPYGIETILIPPLRTDVGLLIVPYGIETLIRGT